MKFDEIKRGDKLVADNGFTCLKCGEVCEVQENEAGLFVSCNVGNHYLDGQLDDDGNVVGFDRAE